MWYDAIHGSSPNHYVTIGATCQTGDLISWDPSAMKLDFYSPHVYPFPEVTDNYNFTRTLNRVKAEMYWFGVMSPMPVVIGETGFVAADDVTAPLDLLIGGTDNVHLDAQPEHHSMPYMHGTEAQQAVFATSTMSYSPSCLISGCAWWEFQNNYSFNLNWDPVYYQGNFWAPLKYGNETGTGPAPWNVEHSWRNKQMVAPLRSTYIPPPGTNLVSPPPHYHDWSLYGQNTLWDATFIDQYNRPVRELLCDVTYVYHRIDNAFPYNLTSHSKSTPDNSGYLAIKSHPSIPGWALIWYELIITTIGGSTFKYSNEYIPNDGYMDLPYAGNTILVHRDYFGYDWSENSVTVDLEQFRDLRGWNSLGLSDVLVHGNGASGGAMWAHARSDVHLVGESHLELGSESHLWNGPTFANCGSSELEGLTISHNVRSQEAAYKNLSGPMELHFDMNLQTDCAFEVLPNPVGDVLFIRSEHQEGRYSIESSTGVQCQNGLLNAPFVTLNTGSWAPGSYIVTLEAISKIADGS